MFFKSKKVIATTCLVGAAPLVVVAWFFGATGLLLPIVVLLVAAIGFLCSGGNARHPTVGDTERFLVGLLAQRGYRGAFRLSGVHHRTADSLGRAVTVRFRATVTITEPLYISLPPPGEICNTLPPRRLAAISTLAQRLDEELGERARGIALRTPPDLYARQYVAARSRQGWSFEFQGVATARSADRKGWTYTLQELSREIEALEQAGRPRGAFPEAIVLDASDGRHWLQDTLRAWLSYEEEVAALQRELQQARTERGNDAIAALFASLQTGTVLAGTAETLTGQLRPAPIEVRITTLDPENRTLRFTLGYVPRIAESRSFSAQVSFDALANVVQVTAATRAEDAVRDGGPLLDAATGFGIDFRWNPEAEPAWTGQGGDFVLRLDAVRGPPATAEEQRQRRDRELWSALTPGSGYRGMIDYPEGARPVTLTFELAPDLKGVVARVERNGSAEIFDVARYPTRGDGYDLRLAPAAVPAPAGAAEPEARPSLRQLLLRVETGGLKGVAEGPGGMSPVELSH